MVYLYCVLYFLIGNHCLFLDSLLFSFSVMHDSSKQPASHSTSAPTSSKEFLGYIHNVSAVYNEKFFNASCKRRMNQLPEPSASPLRKHKIFADFEEKKSLIKIKKFRVDTNANASDLLMGHDVIVEHYPELDFQRAQIQSSNTLLSVKSVRIGQHVTVKAKVINMSKELKG